MRFKQGWEKAAFSLCAMFLATNLFGTDYYVNNSGDTAVNTGGAGSGTSGDFRYVLNQILNNQAQEVSPSTHTVSFSVPSVTLRQLPPGINLFYADTITIGNSSGTPTTIDGSSLYRPFFIAQGTVTLQNMVIQNGLAQGGNGGNGGAPSGAQGCGGGGMGAGGAVYVDGFYFGNTSVTISNVSFVNNGASAGRGGTPVGSPPNIGSSGGGGGLGGNGGNGGTLNYGAAGGGGVVGHGGDGGAGTFAGGGAGGGGFGGNGGIGNSAGGGGGGAIIGADGGNGNEGGTGGNGGTVGSYVFGGGGGGPSGNGGGTGGAAPGGGGYLASGPAGGMGGGGAPAGGNAGYGGNGGGAGAGYGAQGGYGGGGSGGYGGGGSTYGGGGGGSAYPNPGGPGGFGGGGGGGGVTGGSGGSGGFGGGGGCGLGTGGNGGGGEGASNATNAQGGDGAAFGGAIFVHSGALTFAGNCSSSGSTVSANNGQGAAVGPGLFIVSGATVNFAPGDGVTMTFSEVIADDSPSSIGTGTWNAGTGGGGSITMQGPGTLVITGNNTYTGTTYITGGRLNVISSIPIGSAGVFVSAGGTLGGTGTVYGGGTIKGTLSPGTSVGVLTLDTSAANVTLGSTAVTNIDLSPAAASKVVITGSGSIALDGTVNASPSAGNYGKSGSYPILEGTYKGTFNPNVTGGMNGYLFSLAYDTNLVNLLYEFVYLIPTEDLYHNELSVANYLNKAFEEGYLPASAIELFINLDHSDLKHAMDSISPARNAFANYITQQVALSLSDLVTKHLDGFRMEQTASLIDTSKKCKPGRCGCKNKTSKWKLKRCACKNTPSKSAFSGWLSGFGKYAHQGAEKQNPAFNFWSDAILGGFDYHLDTNNLVGTSIGYAGSYFSEAHQKTHGHINYYFANLYGNAYVDNLYFSPSIWGIFNDTQNIRKIAFPGYAAKAEAKICAWQLVPHLEVGYNLKYKWGSLTPFTSVDWAITWQRKYEEQGAIFFNARSKAKSNSILRSETGVKRFERWDNCWGSFFLQEKIAYVFETLFGTDDVATALTGIPIDFTTKALQKNLNLADIAIDFAVAFGKKKSTTLSLGYEGQVGPHYWSNQVVLALNKMF